MEVLVPFLKKINLLSSILPICRHLALINTLEIGIPLLDLLLLVPLIWAQACFSILLNTLNGWQNLIRLVNQRVQMDRAESLGILFELLADFQVTLGIANFLS